MRLAFQASGTPQEVVDSVSSQFKRQLPESTDPAQPVAAAITEFVLSQVAEHDHVVFVSGGFEFQAEFTPKPADGAEPAATTS